MKSLWYKKKYNRDNVVFTKMERLHRKKYGP